MTTVTTYRQRPFLSLLAPLLLLMVLPSALPAQIPAGREFVVALPSYWRTIDAADPGTFQITIMCSRRTNVTVKWSGPTGGVIDQGTIEANNRLTVQSGLQFPVVNFIQPYLDKIKQEVNQRSFHISADQPVSVFAMYDDYRKDGSYSAAWAVPPVESYGTEFLALTYMAFTGKNNGFLITAAEDDTEVTFDPRVQWDSPSDADPVPVTKTLKKHQVFQVQSFAKGGADSSDLSGTPITANKPVGLIAFALRTNAQAWYPNDSTTAEQYSWRESALGAALPPESFGGTLYYTAPMAPHDTSQVRVIALVDGTDVTVNGVFVRTLARGEWLNQAISGATRIQTTEPTLAMQISRSGNNPVRDTALRLDNSNPNDRDTIQPIFGNPAMAWLPPVERYLPTLQWTNPLLAHRRTPIPGKDSILLYPWHHYALITAPTNALASVRLDGQPVTFQYTHIDGAYATAVVGVNPRQHLLTADAPISCIAYGFGWNDAYALESAEALRSIARLDADTIRGATCDSTFDVRFQIANRGNNNFRIDSINADGATIRSTRAPNSYPTEFPPGREYDAHIIMSLPQTGTYRGTIYIYTDANNQNVLELPFVLTRDSARVETVSEINFGQIDAGVTSKDTVITLKNVGTGPVTITNLVFDDPQFSVVSPSLPRTVPAGGTLAITARITPREGVPERGALSIIGEPCMAPVIIPASGLKGRGGILAVDRLFSFPSNVCEAEPRDTLIIVRNLGDEPITLQNAGLSGSNASLFSIITNPTPSDLLPGGADTFTVRFAPVSPIGQAVAFLDLRTSQSVDPVRIELRGRFDTARVEPLSRTIRFDTVLSCSQGVTQTITLRNSGTVTASITEAETGDGSQFEVLTATPVDVFSQNSSEIRVRFRPIFAGTDTTVLVLRGSPCGIEERITLIGTVLRPALDLDEDSISFGDALVCDGVVRRTITLRNTGDTPDTLRRANISGSEHFQLSEPAWPVVVPPGSTAELDLSFTPTVAGAFSGQAEFLWGPCNGSTTVEFSGTALVPSFSTSLDTIDFGQVDIGAPEGVARVTITNDGNTDRTISLALPGIPAGVRVIEPTAPVTLAPGESLEVRLGFDPDEAGALLGTLAISTADPCAQQSTVVLLGEGTGSDEIASDLSLQTGTATGMVNDIVDIPIVIPLDSDGPNGLHPEAVAALNVELRYRASLLYPIAIEQGRTTITGTILSSEIQGEQRVVTLQFSGSGFTPGTTVGYLRARVLLGDRSETVLDLENLVPTVNPGHIVTSTTTDGRFTALGICTIDGERLITTGGGLKILPPYPAPAIDVTNVPFVVDRQGWHTLILYDAAGNVRMTIPLGELTRGGYSTTVDVSSLPSGYYRFEIGDGNARASVPFLVRK